MHLSKIKMSGFKSFVDPTTIELPSHLVAIVGPNGCGKSNIIDAITWVMGESSPKYLRGEALVDVIFNGSNTRKPVGQASVELVFDNSDGTIGGEFAKFSDLSIKRIINRESDSSYFLNGARCRKRDVVDIFLGTGLGPRSYSIVGQNMINRIIEAKPDELRTYLEEAAGISKYKERRHETELRIQHTKENLARVNDLRVELEKQLSHLKHQANVAEKFKTLKEQERITQAELYAVEWRQLDNRIVDFTLKIQREETALESRQSDLTTTDRDIEQLRHEQRVAQDAFQEVQRRYYAVGNEITRVEQEILHHQERQQQWETDLNKTDNEMQGLQNQSQEMEDDIHEFEQEFQPLQPQLNETQAEARTLQAQLRTDEEAMQTWQNRWDEFNQASAKASQAAQVEKTHIQHLEQRISMLQNRLGKIQQEQNQFNFSELTHDIDTISRSIYELADKLELENKKLNEIRQELIVLHATQQDSLSNLDKIRNEIQKLNGQQASLEALQQTALGQRDNPVLPWLTKHQLQNKTRLAQQINVEKGWEFAVEKVLGSALQAVCTDEITKLIPHIDQLETGNLCVFDLNEKPQAGTDVKANLLLAKIQSSLRLDSLLAGIYTAETREEALKLCESLKINESVITKDGVWLNRAWLKLLRKEDPSAGVFQREQEIKQINSRITQLKITQEELDTHIKQRSEKIKALEQQRDLIQDSYNKQQSQAAHFNAQHKMKQEVLSQLKLRAERFITEQEECTQQLKQTQTELEQARNHWQGALQQLEQQTTLRDELTAEREHVRQQLQITREKLNQKKDQIHELEMKSQTIKSQSDALKQNLIRIRNQLTTLSERKTTLQSELSSIPPIDNLKKTLSRTLDKHVSLETELNTARVSIESLDMEYRNLEEKRQTLEKDINKIRTILESLRVDWQGWKVKADTIQEQMKVTEFKLEDVLKELKLDITIEAWQAKLEQIVNRINRLGPINLIAIEEYATCKERMDYLDNQVADLQAALATLDGAIAKIDKETRQLFKDTYDKVNLNFQELFPTMFGGGKAYLELTSDDLLETGVTVMACPPGKRNSSIYLLSGGEKTLTAISLIFSIFNLNPAPFCLLDEVDAALDDANVIRFGRLLKVMTDKTQFIYISHNKIAIELAEHLIGVTMNEPGVSRLVSVDMEKAISLAGT